MDPGQPAHRQIQPFDTALLSGPLHLLGNLRDQGFDEGEFVHGGCPRERDQGKGWNGGTVEWWNRGNDGTSTCNLERASDL